MERADMLIFGIGSLYTSLIPNLLPARVKTAILNSKARKVYLCNAMQQPGETNGHTMSMHLEAIHRHVGAEFMEVVVADTTALPVAVEEKYAADGVGKVQVDSDQLSPKVVLVKKELIDIDANNWVRHNPYRIAEVIRALL
jgi:uncharacterized cofD-like protein